ncbi:hypothetical protein AXG93_1655s1020 [Marchantia polymorpha subsp. ruderalis]|uniref:Uncharacterized protein n=1 Tax=Marchantia polymorpha subsp. ruderalis TaxID=1480154 RepID=A0A176W3M8_MARPO|nr:hypothetical protein AXG93_1655s1020 [Marchantia polymorpha subsp. ruderalis]
MALNHGEEHGGTEEALGYEKEQWREEEGSEDGLGEEEEWAEVAASGDELKEEATKEDEPKELGEEAAMEEMAEAAAIEGRNDLPAPKLLRALQVDSCPSMLMTNMVKVRCL